MTHVPTPLPTGHYVWFDTEYSNLKLEDAVLLQVAARITDHTLQCVTDPDEDINVVVRIDDNERLSPWIQENLPKLAAACRSEDAADVNEVDDRLCRYVDNAVGSIREDVNERPVLAGNSIHADWFLVRKFLPGFLGRLHYRFLDVTSLKLQWQDYFRGQPFDKEDVEAVREHCPNARLAQDAKLHDAYYDIQASIAELAYYRAGLTLQTDAS